MEGKENRKMNKVVLMGRLTKDPDIRYTQGSNPICVARYTLAVDRRFHKDGEQAADFISCVVFGKGAEFAQKYLGKGTKICISGRIQTGSYINKDGQKVYTTDVVVEEQDFAESKATSRQNSERNEQTPPTAPEDDFMSIPDGMEQEELPFK